MHVQPSINLDWFYEWLLNSHTYASTPDIRPSVKTCAWHAQVRQLGDDKLAIRAAIAARELLHAPEKHVQCIAAGMTPALLKCLQASPVCLKVKCLVPRPTAAAFAFFEHSLPGR